MRMWDVRPYAPDERCTKIFSGHTHNFEKNLLKCAWSPDGKRVAAGSADRMVNVWEASSGKMLCVAHSPHVITPPSYTTALTLYLYPPPVYMFTRYKLPGHDGSVNDVDFHPEEPILASASSDKTIYLGELE